MLLGFGMRRMLDGIRVCFMIPLEYFWANTTGEKADTAIA